MPLQWDKVDNFFNFQAINRKKSENPYDSDGLLTINDPVQDQICNLIRTHEEEVSALRRELSLTR